MKKLYFLLLIFFISSVLFADNIDNYIQIGLENNLALKQKKFNYQKSIHALREARGKFFPSLSIEARYTRAGGGREIDFPVGDLLNPVYSTLNQLTGSQSFPQLENQSILFLRKKEHETKLRLVQPIYQSALFSNYNVKDELNESSQDEVNLYKQELIKQIKTAFYQYIQASRVKELYQGTIKLVDENVRVSQVLYDNDMATQDVIFRAKTEKLKVEQQLASAIQKDVLAKSYFNFLLNRDLDAAVEIDSAEVLPINSLSLGEAENQALQKRKEINQLTHAVNASRSLVTLASANYYPGLNLVMDYGYQGTEYRFDKNDDYWMASVLLSWNLFNGFQDSEKRQQAVIDKKAMETRLQELKQNIVLQVKEAYYALETAKKNYEKAKEQESYNNESFKIISGKYKQGMASQIELIDARVNMTNSGISAIVSYYDYLIKYVQFVQLTGSLTFEETKE